MKTTQTATQVIPILGDPVAQVATPRLWNEVFHARGQDAVCVPIDLPATGLEPFLRWVREARNVPGFLTTIPHKASLAVACDELSATARLLGVVNTVRLGEGGTLIGEMFDGHGMLDAIEQSGATLAGARLVICGAGAAGGAIALEAANRHAEEIALIDADPERASALAEKVRSAASLRVTTEMPDGADILVNASPAGSPGAAPPPFVEALIAGARCVADALTDPEETALLKTARLHGIPAVAGKEMAACQAERMRAFLGLEQRN
ncbi:hypothetical protein LCM08_14795 [Salipiger pacificus]|nr:hypothetical protein [Alloyangia pacifica]MCA0946184.1 hypothetical protein [Alloyangia pacifica]